MLLPRTRIVYSAFVFLFIYLALFKFQAGLQNSFPLVFDSKENSSSRANSLAHSTFAWNHNVPSAAPSSTSTWNVQSDGNFWASFAPLLAAAAPRVPPPNLDGGAPVDLISKHPGIAEEPINNHIRWEDPDAAVASMKGSHDWFIKQLRSNAPKVEYKRGTKGIVTAAGGLHLPVLAVTLLTLRHSGSELPVEIFMANNDEYEKQACDGLFKELNAKCIVMSDLLRGSDLQFTFKSYQLKPFSLLFSSFEETLFLDSDNLPMRKPEELFETEGYKEKGLILWPDFWTPTASPYLNQIVGLGERIFQQRGTTEAGQILLDKKMHADTLLLACYYNTYDQFFYVLQSQGAPGQGDKETFGTAALVLNNSFYTVAEPPRIFGSSNVGGVLQFHPVEDWAVNPENPHRNESASAPKPFFIHGSGAAKLNPKDKFRGERQWGTVEESEQLFGQDVEPVVWGQMVKLACDDEVQFENWGDKNLKVDDSNETVHMCEKQRESFRNMFGWEYGTGIEMN